MTTKVKNKKARRWRWPGRAEHNRTTNRAAVRDGLDEYAKAGPKKTYLRHGDPRRTHDLRSR